MQEIKANYDDFLKAYIVNELNNLRGKEIKTNDIFNIITQPVRKHNGGYLFKNNSDAIIFISVYITEACEVFEKMLSLNSPINPISEAKKFVDFMVDIDVTALLEKSEIIKNLINSTDSVLFTDRIINSISKDLKLDNRSEIIFSFNNNFNKKFHETVRQVVPDIINYLETRYENMNIEDATYDINSSKLNFAPDSDSEIFFTMTSDHSELFDEEIELEYICLNKNPFKHLSEIYTDIVSYEACKKIREVLDEIGVNTVTPEGIAAIKRVLKEKNII